MKRGKDLLETILGHSQRTCPACKRNLGPVGLPRLVYTFESCSCKIAPYAHLIETVWHRDCFKQSEGKKT